MTSTGRSTGGALNPGDLLPQAQGDERRVEPRVPCNRRITILPSHPRHRGGFIDVTMFDCSRRGIGILADAPMEPREQFVAKLVIERLMMVVYTVRHCRRLGPREYQIGAELTRLAGMEPTHSDDFLDALLKNDHAAG